MTLLTELNQEISSFKTETARVQEIKRKLQFEKDKLSRELRDFEQQREAEMKKIEEERRKLKRDKLLLDKATREARSPSSNCSNCQENKVRTQRILSELNTNKQRNELKISNIQQ